MGGGVGWGIERRRNMMEGFRLYIAVVNMIHVSWIRRIEFSYWYLERFKAGGFYARRFGIRIQDE